MTRNKHNQVNLQNRGISIVELVVAGLILTIVMLAFTQWIGSSVKSGAYVRSEQEAIELNKSIDAAVYSSNNCTCNLIKTVPSPTPSPMEFLKSNYSTASFPIQTLKLYLNEPTCMNAAQTVATASSSAAPEGRIQVTGMTLKNFFQVADSGATDQWEGVLEINYAAWFGNRPNPRKTPFRKRVLFNTTDVTIGGQPGIRLSTCDVSLNAVVPRPRLECVVGQRSNTGIFLDSKQDPNIFKTVYFYNAAVPTPSTVPGCSYTSGGYQCPKWGIACNTAKGYRRMGCWWSGAPVNEDLFPSENFVQMGAAPIPTCSAGSVPQNKSKVPPDPNATKCKSDAPLTASPTPSPTPMSYVTDGCFADNEEWNGASSTINISCCKSVYP